MSRNRSKKSANKPLSIASISSHVPLMATSTDTTANIHNATQSFQMASTHDSKRARTVYQPKGTTSYTVTDNDTLEKVALRFNSTPSELRQLNKLTTRTIFPGQVLFVPEERSSDNSNQSQQSTTSMPSPLALSPSALTKPKEGDAFILLTDRRLSNENPPTPSLPSPRQLQQDVGPMVWSMTRQTNPRPGHAHRLKSDSSVESEHAPRTLEERLTTQNEDNSKEVQKVQRSLSIEENQQLDEECLQRFIKLHVRLMTEDHQSVAGTLLVTPNAVMFDPDVLDPLIRTHGIDKYGLIIRMDLLAGIALYEDLALYEHEATARDEEKRKMYHSISVKSLQHSQKHIPLNTDEQQIHDLMIYILDKLDKELNPTDTCMLFDASTHLRRHLSKNSSGDDQKFLPISQTETYLDDSLQIPNDSFQPLDDYKHSLGILLDDKDDKSDNFNEIPSEVSYVFDWTQFKRAVKVKKGCHLESCVPLGQYNKRFGEIDKLLYKHQQNYLSPPPIEIPYYLCIRTSVQTYDIPSLRARQYKQPSEIKANNSHTEKPLEHEYWFAVPKEKIEHLYSFFLRWTPERELDPLIDDDDPAPPPTVDHSKSNDKTPNRGFVLLVNDDPELTDISENDQQHKHYLTHQNSLLKEWEYNNNTTNRSMIGTLSTTSSNSSCSSNEHELPLSPPPEPPPPSSRSRRFSLHSLATRLSDSKKNLLEQIPHHQQQFTRFRKRAGSYLSSTLTDHLSDIHSAPSERRKSTAGIISVDEIYRRINSAHPHNNHFYDDGLPAPKFLHQSTLINEEQAKEIMLELPARLQGLDWYMIFSTEKHGFSLNQLYRRSFELDRDSPALLIVKDVEQNIFGAFVPHQLTISEGFYGTGESFLFAFNPKFRVFNWSGGNNFFVKGDLHSLGFGIGDGTYALWLDGDLYHGRTSSSKTFNNERLTSNEDFIVASVEVWTFTD